MSRRTYGSPEKSQSGSVTPQKKVRSKTTCKCPTVLTDFSSGNKCSNEGLNGIREQKNLKKVWESVLKKLTISWPSMIYTFLQAQLDDIVAHMIGS